MASPRRPMVGTSVTSFGSPTYKALGQQEERGVLQRYSDMSQQFETSASKRGITRSGFAAEQENKIGAQEEGAIADVHAGLTDRLMQYRYQQDQLNLMKQQLKSAKSSSRNQWIGVALSVVGSVAGALI